MKLSATEIAYLRLALGEYRNHLEKRAYFHYSDFRPRRGEVRDTLDGLVAKLDSLEKEVA